MNRGKLVEVSSWQSPDNQVRYGSIEELEKLILMKKVKSITENRVILENGVVLTIECTESDCCAGGRGKFEWDEWSDMHEALITDFVIGKQIDVPNSDTIVRRNAITLYHNNNPIALANAQTDAGNGGYYYSVTSLVVGEIAFPFVKA